MAVTVSASRSVLCVDSDPATHHVIADILSAYDTVPALNAFEALREVNSKPFDLYVLEYWLPDLPGIQLCREIRKVDPQGPILFCSSTVRDEDRKRAVRAGANAYLAKPIDPPQFMREARIVLEAADLQSVRAKLEEERAVQDELVRLGEIAKTRTLNAIEAAGQSMKRTARAKALKAFVESGGTRANFERWWPQLSESLGTIPAARPV